MYTGRTMFNRVSGSSTIPLGTQRAFASLQSRWKLPLFLPPVQVMSVSPEYDMDLLEDRIKIVLVLINVGLAP